MFCHFVFLHRSNTVPDPNLEIRGEGPVSPPIFFWPLRPQFCLPPQKQHSARSRPWNKGGRPGLPPHFFLALWASVWSKNKGGQPPQNPPLDHPLQHNLVPLRASWLPSLLLAIILYYWCHFLNITTVLQIWSMLRVAYYEKLAEEFVPISHGEIFLMNDDKFYLNEWMDTFI